MWRVTMSDSFTINKILEAPRGRHSPERVLDLSMRLSSTHRSCPFGLAEIILVLVCWRTRLGETGSTAAKQAYAGSEEDVR
jgi:hypothetical protein